MRVFPGGATRDDDDTKLDYEGSLSPLVLRRYAEYLHEHRLQADGKMRDSDNWQKGIPMPAYMKSLWRHFMDMWSFHRHGCKLRDIKRHEDAVCAVLFNATGYLHELLKRNATPEVLTCGKDYSKYGRNCPTVRPEGAVDERRFEAKEFDL